VLREGPVMIEIDIVGNRIHLTSPYDPRTVAACKRVPGANWAKTVGAWTFPATIETCLLLRAEFGAQLKIRKALSHWYRDAKIAREQMADLNLIGAAVALPRLEKLAPALHEAVTVGRRYQSRGARFMVEGGATIIADDPGLGKTLEVLAAIVEHGLPGPYLVVSPKTAATSVWPREIPRWIPEANVIELPEGRAKRDAILSGLVEVYRQNQLGATGFDLSNTWISVHPEAVLTKSFWDCPEIIKGSLESTGAEVATVCGVSTPYTRKPTPELACGHEKPKGLKVRNEHTFPQLFEIEWGALVVDECHESLVMKSGTPTQRRRGLELLRPREGALRVASSGTPFRSKPEQLWGVLNWLRPKVYSGKWGWVKKYWETGGFTGWEIGKIREDREEMLWADLGGIMLRRTKAEVAPDLPPKTYVGTPLDPSDANSPVGIWLPMSKSQSRAYKQMTQQSFAELGGGSRLEAIGTLAELTRLQQFASSYGTIDSKGDFMPTIPSNKLDWLEEFLESLGIPKEPTGKVIVVSQYTRLLRMLSFGLSAIQSGVGCMLTGEVTGAKRRDTIDRFNEPVGSDSPHVMFMNVKAGGTAITIDSADDMVILDEADPDTMTQVEDRIHRVSNPRPVRYHYLRSMDSVDVGISLVNADRSAQGRRLLDGRRGVEFFRKVLELS